jgi:hypothetical protein
MDEARDSPDPGHSRVRNFGEIEKIEGGNAPIGDQLLVHREHQVDAVSVD